MTAQAGAPTLERMWDCDSNARRKFARHLLARFDAHQRALPWRRTRHPYRIWISEIMLAQTQVDRVVEFYRTFVARFPNVRSLAQARWPALLARWRGLGYYNRARNLQRAAREIVEHHGGRFPRDFAAIGALPGIGRYTAGAIASIAFGERRPALDTNAARVIHRVFGTDQDRLPRKPPEEMWWEFAAWLVPRHRPGDFNQALMEFGALVCTARAPRCPQCPMRRFCRAAASVASGERTSVFKARSTPTRRATPGAVPVAVAVIRDNGLYLVQRRTRGQRLAGTWEFPGGKLEPGETGRAALKRECREELGIEIAAGRTLLRVEHAYPDVTVDVRFFACTVLKGTAFGREGQRVRWVTRAELETLKTPPATAKVIAVLR